MAKKRRIPDKYQKWIYARKRFRLSHAHIQMAKEFGLNPKKSSKNRQMKKNTNFDFPEKIIYSVFSNHR